MIPKREKRKNFSRRIISFLPRISGMSYEMSRNQLALTLHAQLPRHDLSGTHSRLLGKEAVSSELFPLEAEQREFSKIQGNTLN
jgi:hypothetical protein